MAKSTAKGESLEQARQAQFPSLDGDSALEVSERSADGNTGTNYEKDFVVLVQPAGRKPSDDEDARSRQGVLREALNRGLHADAEAEFKSAETHADGVSTVWHYSVAVTPAAIDDNAETAVTPAHSEYQPESN